MGDGNSGKTSLLWRIKHQDDKELPKFTPTVVGMDGFKIDDTFIEFVDTAGQDDYKEVRTKCYTGADLFVILCTADSNDTLHNVR